MWGVKMDFLFGRYSLMVFAFIGAVIFGLAGTVEPVFLVIAFLLGLLAMIGLYDYCQKKRAVLGNYPLLAGFGFCLNPSGLNCANIFGNLIMTNCPIRAISGQWFINAQKA